MATGIIMADVLGASLSDEDRCFLQHKEIGGVILFARNVESPEQVRALTDAMRAVNPNLLIAADQEGGRVARFRKGFSALPAMGRLGELYDTNQQLARAAAYDTGYLMACEVLAVGVDFSFAPVLDVNGCSSVIGDRAFHQDAEVITVLASDFMRGMKDAGMATTGKHFPGHGSVAPDSHVAEAIDQRCFDDIWSCDTITFANCLSHLDALMPAHVIFSQVDDKPAGFSRIWLQDIVRKKLGFDGVIFSDDLSMKAAHAAGTMAMRVLAAIEAGCDMVLVCNNREDAIAAVDCAKTIPENLHQRFIKMKANIPVWQGSLAATCQAFDYYAAAKQNVQKVFFDTPLTPNDQTDPTAYLGGGFG